MGLANGAGIYEEVFPTQSLGIEEVKSAPLGEGRGSQFYLGVVTTNIAAGAVKPQMYCIDPLTGADQLVWNVASFIVTNKTSIYTMGFPRPPGFDLIVEHTYEEVVPSKFRLSLNNIAGAVDARMFLLRTLRT